jgi:hypothetical protein
MAESIVQQNLAELLRQKIILYHDLRDCLNRERAHLIDMDLNLLWDISVEKEAICRRIASVRNDIGQALEGMADSDSFETLPALDRILEQAPGEKKEALLKLCHTLVNLKHEIRILSKENVAYVDESLVFIDEMITIIAGESHTANGYNQKCRMKKAGKQMFLYREA